MAKRKFAAEIPSYDELIIPTLRSLKLLGGSGSIEEINAKVYEIENIQEEILKIPHGDEGGVSEMDYRLAWSRTYLKKSGFLENSARGIWALIKPEVDINKLNYKEIVNSVRGLRNDSTKKTEDNSIKSIEKETEKEVESEEKWKEKLLKLLYGISPSAFERLTQRILRESGFSQVEVTGQSGDGGIDGKGIIKVGGLLSFHVIFQCKRYKGSVSSSQIRDFRGAMQGRADKGLVITTGIFTKDALKEATRDGAPPIDMIDGEMLCDKLKELNLGVETKLIEVIEIKNEWFGNL